MSAECAPDARVTGLSLLVDWANQQDHWIRMLVGEVIETRRRLSDPRIEALFDVLLREKELAEGDAVSVEPLSATAASARVGTTIRLKSLRHIENVNALTPDQVIEFHERLTVCFGENASGKTGYVRILKRAAAVRTADPVLSNVHQSGTGGTPQAKITATVGDQEQCIDWRGEQEVEPLTRIDVFDARAAVLHVTEDLNYSYTPAELALFPLVADGIDRVQGKLQTAKSDRHPRTNPFVNRFQRESRLYPKIEGLGASTNLQELESLAQISEGEEAALAGLREKVEALRSGSVRAQSERAEREAAIFQHASGVAEAVGAFDRDAYKEAVSALRTARGSQEQATRKALAGQDVPGILGDAWKGFIEAAESYVQEVDLDPYPADGEACIYCRQPLGDAAVVLLRKYRDYCNDAFRQAVEEARERVRTIGAAILELDIDGAQRGVDSLVQALEDSSQLPPPLSAARDVVELPRSSSIVPTSPSGLLRAPRSELARWGRPCMGCSAPQ